MLVLGLNGNFSSRDDDLVPGMLEFFFHDAAACLVRDGTLLAAVEEERFNRIKKTTSFPVGAITACLEEGGVGPGDVDAVGYYFREDHVDVVLHQLYLENPTVPVRYSRDLIKHRLRADFGWELPDDRLLYVSHHDAHAASSLVHSGLESALVVIMDGRGEDCSGSVFHARGGVLERLATYPVHQSLGMWYLSATMLLGYRFGDEYKVMGLAPLGDPARYREVFRSLYALRDGGRYELAANIATPNAFGPAMFAQHLPLRRRGAPFTAEHRDFAAALQENLERITMHVLRHWAGVTGARHLCFGGGVAHNSSLNGVILRSGLFDEVYVHPASHDPGAGVGAALVVGQRLAGGPLPRVRLRDAALGGGLGDERRIASGVKAWSGLVAVVHEGVDRADTIDVAARLLADGSVIGWAQGRSEFGPRALGSRSIVADPRPQENQTRINAMVKKRESFRPFAPVVTPESVAVYFELPDAVGNHDFMSFVLPVRPEHRAHLGAVTHVDGTARLQVVTAEVNPSFHGLVTRFGELTGTAMLLNTSFNNHAEPIVETLDDVLTSFLTTELDHLVVGDLVLRRRADFLSALGELVPHLPTRVRLVSASGVRTDGERLATHEIVQDHAVGSRTVISAAVHEVLSRADGVATLSELVGGPLTEPLRSEVFRLWSERYLRLLPA